ncbi:MAG: hypothetical protein AAFQ80_04380 [Cyanobacteria bacterium J06621_8]
MLLSSDRNKAHSQQKGRGSTAVVATESPPSKEESNLIFSFFGEPKCGLNL